MLHDFSQNCMLRFSDPSETRNVAAEYPKLIAEMIARADSMRARLGDKLLQIKGTENREPGRLK